MPGSRVVDPDSHQIKVFDGLEMSQRASCLFPEFATADNYRSTRWAKGKLQCLVCCSILVLFPMFPTILVRHLARCTSATCSCPRNKGSFLPLFMEAIAVLMPVLEITMRLANCIESLRNEAICSESPHHLPAHTDLNRIQVHIVEVHVALRCSKRMARCRNSSHGEAAADPTSVLRLCPRLKSLSSTILPFA